MCSMTEDRLLILYKCAFNIKSFYCACVTTTNAEAARVSIASTDDAKSNSSDHRKSSVDQESAAAAERNPSTPRHSVRFADSCPPPLAQTTAGVDVHDTGISPSPPDSANSVKVVETQQQQQPAGARSLTARISSTPGKEPRSVAV